MTKSGNLGRWLHRENQVLWDEVLLNSTRNESFRHLNLINSNRILKRKTSTIWYHLHMESKIWHTYLQTEMDSDTENRLVAPKGEGERRERDWEFGVSRCKLLHRERINKVLLYSTGNYTQHPGINHNGKEYKKDCTCVYNWVTLVYGRY